MGCWIRSSAALLWLLAGAAAAEPARRVGLVWNSPPQAEVQSADSRSRHPGRRLIEERLRELGWKPGQDLEFVSRSAESRYDRFPAIIDEMVARRVDVIVVFGRESLRVAKARAPRIPVVLSQGFNSRSGRSTDANVTGMAIPNPVGKRIELLKAIAPTARRVAMIARVAPGEAAPTLSEPFVASVRKVGLDPFALYFAEPEELEAVFAEAVRRKASAMYMSGFPRLTWDEAVQHKVIGLAAEHRIPTVYELPELARAGALIGFGFDDREVHHKTADYVDRILRGSRPEQLPLEEPTRYLLKINARTARELGLAIPGALRVQADEIFE